MKSCSICRLYEVSTWIHVTYSVITVVGLHIPICLHGGYYAPSRSLKAVNTTPFTLEVLYYNVPRCHKNWYGRIISPSINQLMLCSTSDCITGSTYLAQNSYERDRPSVVLYIYYQVDLPRLFWSVFESQEIKYRQEKYKQIYKYLSIETTSGLTNDVIYQKGKLNIRNATSNILLRGGGGGGGGGRGLEERNMKKQFRVNKYSQINVGLMLNHRLQLSNISHLIKDP